MGVPLYRSQVGLCHGQSHLEMDDDWGYPHFRNPHIHQLGHGAKGHHSVAGWSKSASPSQGWREIHQRLWLHILLRFGSVARFGSCSTISIQRSAYWSSATGTRIFQGIVRQSQMTGPVSFEDCWWSGHGSKQQDSEQDVGRSACWRGTSSLGKPWDRCLYLDLPVYT